MTTLATTARDLLRDVRFSPYRRGMGPTFRLQLWHTGMVGEYGKDRIAYKLTMREPGARKPVTLFKGNDLYLHVREDDAADAVRCCMGFLTLRDGDTDEEYFADYTPAQLAYRDAHAESLSIAVLDAFGED